ncbi:MAG: hypothetical protein KGL18_08875 [Burkholderiales bacterium]|nr:hypothetical protein [Burkholderiales bacterium]MDE1925861.1 hypothetical protein [Burkholderiales bacterium]MDE2157408.1 hypothetical protein [Burkholderiales bacterium]MDE2503072.1 hypothetical protein [Burkholderiales bacterium]
MNALPRTGPLRGLQDAEGLTWSDDDGMAQVARYADDESQRLAAVAVGEIGARRRHGIKGAGTAAWLHERGVPTPPRANQWLRTAEGDWVLRLGDNEYLVEAAPGSELVPMLAAAAPAARVHPVPRFDAALVLCGPRVHELLRQTCSYDFAALAVTERLVVLTSMVGVGVTLLRDDAGAIPLYRLWCDGSWGEYLWTTLVEVAQSLGGGAVGSQTLSPLIAGPRGRA